MEKLAMCKKLVATYKDDKCFLEGPYKCCLDIEEKGNTYHIEIEQLGTRKIIIAATDDTSIYDLKIIFSRIERLLMILEGCFIPLDNIQLTDSISTDEKILKSCGAHFNIDRLSYFSSADFCKSRLSNLLPFSTTVSSDLFYKWESLLQELDIVHQVYLYSISDSGITVDVKCSFLIELAESLVEIVKVHFNLFDKLKPGHKGTSLKMCIDGLIQNFGNEIFNKELSNKYDEFLNATVNSRVRVMHIKREQKGLFFNGQESILYCIKFSLLYRRIILELLGIDKKEFINKLKKYVTYLDQWNDTLEKFMLKL